MSMLGARMTAGCSMLLLIAAAPSESARVGYVIDGDTFRLASGERIRIAGMDASASVDNSKRFKEARKAGEAQAGREIALAL